jgi:hypothetical protein
VWLPSRITHRLFYVATDVTRGKHFSHIHGYYTVLIDGSVRVIVTSGSGDEETLRFKRNLLMRRSLQFAFSLQMAEVLVANHGLVFISAPNVFSMDLLSLTPGSLLNSQCPEENTAL